MSGFRVRQERRAEISNKSLTFLFLRGQEGHFEVEEQAREMEREREKGTPGGAQSKKEKKQGSGAEDERGGAKFRPWRGRREGEEEEEEEEQNCLGWLSNSRVAAVAEVPDTQWRWRRGNSASVR